MVDVHPVGLVGHPDHVLTAEVAATLELPGGVPRLVLLMGGLHVGADVGPGSGVGREFGWGHGQTPGALSSGPAILG